VTAPCRKTPLPSNQAFSARGERPVRGGSILVVGDTQRTALFESLIGRESNEAEQCELVAMMASEPNVAYVLHLGDMVVEGGSDHEWAYYTRLMAPLAARELRVYPVLGNHDYSGPRAVDRAQADPLANARRYSPELAAAERDNPPRTYYAKVLDGLGLIFLDSNLQHDTGRAAEQTRWLESQLANLDADASVRAVLLLSHHPPFTSGKNRQGDEYMRRVVVPRMLSSRKGVVLLSGHVHGYERFEIGDRTFVVSGGGGGPRVKYLPARGGTPAPAYVHRHSGFRPLNYLVIRDQGTRLDFSVRCLPEPGDESSCPNGRLDSFSVSVPVAVPTRASPLASGSQ
jgi:hypothetical protein